MKPRQSTVGAVLRECFALIEADYTPQELDFLHPVGASLRPSIGYFWAQEVFAAQLHHRFLQPLDSPIRQAFALVGCVHPDETTALFLQLFWQHRDGKDVTVQTLRALLRQPLAPT